MQWHPTKKLHLSNNNTSNKNAYDSGIRLVFGNDKKVKICDYKFIPSFS